MGDFSSFQEVLDILHANDVQYLILRNFDNLLTPEMYQDGHGDVDMLCEDSEFLADTIGAKYFIKKNGELRADKTHYYITIDGKRVSIDMRVVGDNYYCEQWERDMLSTRVMNNGFYVMNNEHQFYSLIYHAILQKPFLSDEYKERLNAMKHDFLKSETAFGEADFIRILQDFMRTKGYAFTYPRDILVPFRSSFVDSSLIARDLNLQFHRWKFETRIKAIEVLVGLKHSLERCIH